MFCRIFCDWSLWWWPAAFSLNFLFCNAFLLISACKRKEQELPMQESRTPKKPRLVFTDIQRRTLHAIFKETKRPSKEMQATIAQQLGLEVTTVANFFMNARRRSLDKWRDDDGNNNRESVSKTSWRTFLSVYQITLRHWIFIYLYVSFPTG